MECGEEKEEIQNINNTISPKCPKCDKKMVKIFYPPTIIMAGGTRGSA